MKTSFIATGLLTLMVFVTNCKKDNQTNADYAAINTNISDSKTALSLSQSYNDTLITYFDTAKVHKNNVNCIKYDKLYHKSDSMFTAHYNMFGGEMYQDDIMMKGYTPGSMMGGGTTNTGMMDMHQIQGDTAMMNGYYNSMIQLHNKHQSYHNSIYN
ncbi:MAG TPA: hypothetical protein VIH57_23710 [Bacteroidales bacterium]